MSIRLILTDNEITINEELKDNETIYNYIDRAINNFDNKDNVNIFMTVQTEKDMIRIAGEYYPAGFVKGKLLKLNYSHIEYVLECMDKNTTKIRNIKQYLLAALFNAPSTIGSYYKAEVNHDMPQYAN